MYHLLPRSSTARKKSRNVSNLIGYKTSKPTEIPTMKLFIHRLICCASLLSVVPAHSCPAQADRQSPAMNTAKMLACNGLPCVDIVTADGKHLKMGLDTGNPTSILDTNAAKTLGLDVQPYRDAQGKEVPGVKIAKLTGVILGTGSLGDVRMVVYDLSKQMTEGTFPKVDGTLAYGLFKNRVVQFDYAKNLFRYTSVLATSVPCPVAQCGKLSFIPFGQHGPPIVVATTGFTVGGKPLSVQIDTMFSGTMLVYPTSVDKLGLTVQSQSKKARHFSFTDEGVDMSEAGGFKEGFANATLLTSAPLYFAGPKVHLPDGLFDGTVGQELFAGHRLTLDFSGMNVWMD